MFTIPSGAIFSLCCHLSISCGVERFVWSEESLIYCIFLDFVIFFAQRLPRCLYHWHLGCRSADFFFLLSFLLSRALDPEEDFEDEKGTTFAHDVMAITVSSYHWVFHVCNGSDLFVLNITLACMSWERFAEGRGSGEMVGLRTRVIWSTHGTSP